MGKTRTSRKSRKILGGSASENDRYLEIKYLDTHGIVRTMIANILTLQTKGDIDSNEIEIEDLLIYMTAKNDKFKIFITYYDLSKPKNEKNLLEDTLIGANGISSSVTKSEPVDIGFTTFIIRCKYMSKKKEQEIAAAQLAEKERVMVEIEKEAVKTAQQERLKDEREKEIESIRLAHIDALRRAEVEANHKKNGYVSSHGQQHGEVRDRP